jgi:hypothetical protein
MLGNPTATQRWAGVFWCRVGYPDRITASIGIPADALPPILQMLIAKEFKFILLRGSKFRYRSARLTGLRLEMRLAEDDMPAEDAESLRAGLSAQRHGGHPGAPLPSPVPPASPGAWPASPGGVPAPKIAESCVPAARAPCRPASPAGRVSASKK